LTLPNVVAVANPLAAALPPVAVAGVPAGAAAPDPGLRKAITMDGAYPQVNEILDGAVVLQVAAAEHIELIKWAAKCSLTMAAADVSPIHRNLHSFFNSSRFNYSAEGNPSVGMLAFIRDFLQPSAIDTSSKKTYVAFLSHLETAVSQSITKKALDEGWQRTGVRPFDVAQILSGFSDWDNLPEATADTLLACAPHFQRVAAREGFVTDQHIDLYLTARGVDIDQLAGRPSDAPLLEDLHPSRRRTIWLNNERFVAEYRQKRAAKAAAKQQAADATAQRRAEAAVRKQAAEQKRSDKEKRAAKRAAKRKSPASAVGQPPAAKRGASYVPLPVFRCANIDCKAKCVRDTAESLGWRKCRRCGSGWYCGLPVCAAALSAHQAVCDAKRD